MKKPKVEFPGETLKSGLLVLFLSFMVIVLGGCGGGEGDYPRISTVDKPDPELRAPWPEGDTQEPAINRYPRGRLSVHETKVWYDSASRSRVLIFDAYSALDDDECRSDSIVEPRCDASVERFSKLMQDASRELYMPLLLVGNLPGGELGDLFEEAMRLPRPSENLRGEDRIKILIESSQLAEILDEILRRMART